MDDEIPAVRVYGDGRQQVRHLHAAAHQHVALLLLPKGRKPSDAGAHQTDLRPDPPLEDGRLPPPILSFCNGQRQDGVYAPRRRQKQGGRLVATDQSGRVVLWDPDLRALRTIAALTGATVSTFSKQFSTPSSTARPLLRWFNRPETPPASPTATRSGSPTLSRLLPTCAPITLAWTEIPRMSAPTRRSAAPTSGYRRRGLAPTPSTQLTACGPRPATGLCHSAARLSTFQSTTSGSASHLVTTTFCVLRTSPLPRC